MNIDAVIFDMDGTLIDSEFIMQIAWNKVLNPYDVYITDELYKGFCGIRSTELIPNLIEAHHLPIDFFEFQRLLKQAVINWIDDENHEIPIMHGVNYVLESLKNARIPLAVATSTRSVLTAKKLKSTGLAKYFEVVVSGDEVEHSKPAPDIYILAYKRLIELYGNIKRIVCVEDSEPGVKSAVDAGFECIAIPNKFTNHHDFSLAKDVFPDLMIAMKAFG